MDENVVVESACQRLKTAGCEIVERRTTKEQGIDIVAHNPSNGHDFYVEAKGGTSSRIGSRRFGLAYTQSQVFDRVAKGVFTCVELRAKYPDSVNQHVILSVPDALWFHSYLDPVLEQLRLTGVVVWFHKGQ
jgi:hypothetical protein